MLLTPVTKLTPPQLHRDLIARPHVLARLAEALHVPLTVLVAPAGFGKTTLLAAWAQALAADASAAVLWLSLDPGDSDPTILGELLITALQRVQSDLGADTLAALRAPQPPPPELALTPLINDLALLPDPLVFILDDYQHCDTPPINHALSFLIERLPPTIHLVLATRSEPQLPLARWRARRRLLELRSADLRFSAAEAADMLGDLTGRALDPATVALLEQRTEGWAAGLQLAGLALRERSDQLAPLDAATLGERYSLDFLASEVLDQLPDQLRSFLLHTSILERLCADLCAATLGPHDPSGPAGSGEQPILEELERRGLFVTPLDAQRTWFRYHPLFAQLLRERLVRSAAAATLAALHRRAGAWLAAHQEPGAAIGHFLAADDVDAALALIETHALPLLFRGQGRTVRAWLAALPPELVGERPALALIGAWTALFTSEMAAAQEYCAVAAAALERDPAALPERHAGLAALRSVLTSFVEQYTAATDAGRTALAQLPADSPLQRMVGAGLAFASLLDGRFDDAEALALSTLAELPVDPATSLLRIHYQTLLAISRRMRGRLNEALTYSTAATTLLAGVRAGAPLPSSIPALTEHAVNRYEAGDCAAATALLDEVDTLYNLGRIERLSIPPAWLRARLRAAEDAYAEAQALLSAALATARRLDLRWSMAFTAGEMVAMALRGGDLPLAYRAAAVLEACAVPPNGLLPSTEVYLAPARMALAEGRPAEALLLLTALYEQAATADRGFLALKALQLSAVAYAAQGDQPAALVALDRAVQQAAPAGFVRAFVDEGAPMYRLLAAYQAASTAEYAFVTHVLSAFPASAGAAGAQLAEPLTDRERTILRLLAAGYSNQAIAAELIIALGTVKRHVANLAAKLGTTSRLATVARARELGLL